MASEIVRSYQKQLRAIGFPIAVDGVNGRKTRQALRWFQEAWTYKNLVIDGVWGLETQKALADCVAKGGRISPHFKLVESKSRGNGWPRFHRDLARGLEKLRQSKGGKPITPNSMHRDPVYNRKIGGARNSQHMHGRAADIGYGYGLTIGQAKRLKIFTGIGYHHKSHRVLHVDVRPGVSASNPTTWTYKSGSGY